MFQPAAATLYSDALILCSAEETLSWLHPTLSHLGISSHFCHDRQNFICALKEDHQYKLIIWHKADDSISHHECCRLVREYDLNAILLVIASEHHESDHILCLEIGANDYLAENYSSAELKARLKAHVARTQAIQRQRSQEVSHDQANSVIVQCKDLIIDVTRRNVFKNKAPVKLTAKEFDILYVLSKRPGQVFSRDQILDAVWGYESDKYAHTVSTHINRLRSKIEAKGEAPFIETLWGVGYKFCDEAKVITKS